MAIYYQHIGRELWARDGPRSIGTPGHGTRQFTLDEISSCLEHLSPQELAKVKRKTNESFQIWGLPTGAQRVLAGMGEGDHLLLLESELFRYAGTVAHYLSEPCWNLSAYIWGEQKFPQIVLLQGRMIRYEWDVFVQEFGFAPNYHMRGNTMKLSKEKILQSRYASEEDFIRAFPTDDGSGGA